MVNGRGVWVEVIANRLRALFVDFNDPALAAQVPWYAAAPAAGEPVVLTDGECNFSLGRVVAVERKPDSQSRTAGFVVCERDASTWLDGADVLSLARSVVEQPTRGTITRTVEAGAPG